MKWIKREKADKKSLDCFLNSVMKIVDIRIQHFKEHFTINNNHNKPISRSKHKLKELAKEFVFVPADKAAYIIIIVDVNFILRFCKRKSRIHQHSN